MFPKNVMWAVMRPYTKRRRFLDSRFQILIFLVTIYVLGLAVSSPSNAVENSIISSDGLFPSKVEVFRCCKSDEVLSEDRQCLKGSVPNWVPNVFSPYSHGFIQDHAQIGHMFTFLEATRPSCASELFHVPFQSHGPINNVVFDNGSLWVQDFDKHLFRPGDYCVDPGGCLVCRGPLPEPSGARKCCGPEAAYRASEQRCVQSDRVWSLGDSRIGFPVCPEPGYAVAGRLGISHILDNSSGSVLGPDGVPLERFCLEFLDEKPEDGTVVLTCPTSGRHPARWNRHDGDLRFTLYPVGLFLSVFFLTVTLIASCLLPSTYHLLHWRCQTNHVACLLVGDLLLAVVQMSGSALDGPACASIGIAMHFIFLAAFFWLNTMCFNIWWTFRDLRPTSLDKGQEVCRLRLYELYAWGGPLLIAGTAACFDSLPDDAYPSDGIFRPKFGSNSCWFAGDAEIFSYFYGPLGVLLLINLTLFGATARELTCGLWKTEVVKSNTERATLGRVCLKLVVVMGVTWVADIISWFVGGPTYVWYLTDLINALQGVLIFAVVGCQPQVWAAVKRLWCLREMPSEGGGIRSSSSHAMPSVGDQNTTTTSTVKPVETLC
ncbi:LOW QUALITY PROTEIN: probable G-protein coupled receptor Mth-like 1 [Nilaparvata lugens]|uniref:LOW QUALITY PROTEIN: probable G-protein coupled receptor Mth-like 1 n=1 Tax=Nilaparvata lugens TaxID=108931 RepID=UPI00193DEDB1|nr:LOW QUALITY PROTEIN: probable G-protein coupled receptor Mth-like 1 [Nilaparvata lugens]